MIFEDFDGDDIVGAALPAFHHLTKCSATQKLENLNKTHARQKKAKKKKKKRKEIKLVFGQLIYLLLRINIFVGHLQRIPNRMQFMLADWQLSGRGKRKNVAEGGEPRRINRKMEN